MVISPLQARRLPRAFFASNSHVCFATSLTRRRQTAARNVSDDINRISDRGMMNDFNFTLIDSSVRNVVDVRPASALRATRAFSHSSGRHFSGLVLQNKHTEFSRKSFRG